MSDPKKPTAENPPDPEVLARPKRRRFTAKYKLRVLRELDACTEPGQTGEVLRREGLYSSHISAWRAKRAAGELQGLSPRRKGRAPKPRNPRAPEMARLERENTLLKEELRKAHLIIDVQKKVSQMLTALTPETDENFG